MANSVVLIVFICVLGACSQKQVEQGNKVKESFRPISEAESTPLPEQDVEKPNTAMLDLPFLGQFELNNAAIDSMNEYEAGDCWGRIKQYSWSQAILAMDSLTCGEYGFTNTYYLLSPKGQIKSVYIQESTPRLNPKHASSDFVLREQIINFKTDPAISKMRIDSASECFDSMTDKVFTRNTLGEGRGDSQFWELQYHETWQSDLDY